MDGVHQRGRRKKKLIDAAAAWAGSKAGGVPLQMGEVQGPAWIVAEQGRTEEAEAFGVLPENLEACEFFFGLGTQWRRDPGGTLEGLRYGALESLLNVFCPSDRQDVFRRVQIMERSAVDAARASSKK